MTQGNMQSLSVPPLYKVKPDVCCLWWRKIRQIRAVAGLSYRELSWTAPWGDVSGADGSKVMEGVHCRPGGQGQTLTSLVMKSDQRGTACWELLAGGRLWTSCSPHIEQGWSQRCLDYITHLLLNQPGNKSAKLKKSKDEDLWRAPVWSMSHLLTWRRLGSWPPLQPATRGRSRHFGYNLTTRAIISLLRHFILQTTERARHTETKPPSASNIYRKH